MSGLVKIEEDDYFSEMCDEIEGVAKEPIKAKPKFWMLYAEGGGAPQKKHGDYMEAMLEAKRIMDQPQWKGARIYVLEATGVVELQISKEFIHKEIKYE